MLKNAVARANTLVFLVLIAIVALVGGITWDRFAASRLARQDAQHTYEVLGTIKDLNLAAHDAETGQRG